VLCTVFMRRFTLFNSPVEIKFLLNGMYATLLSTSWSTFPVWKFCRCKIIVPIPSVVVVPPGTVNVWCFSSNVLYNSLVLHMCLLHQSLSQTVRYSHL
jgi:hypothetical protein